MKTPSKDTEASFAQGADAIHVADFADYFETMIDFTAKCASADRAEADYWARLFQTAAGTSGAKRH